MEECKQAMEALGRSMERMAARGYREKESWLCMKAANSLYFMCLYIRRIDALNDPEAKQCAEFYCKEAFRALREACSRYADTTDDTILEGVLEGMKALHTFEHAKQVLRDYLQRVQPDNESSQSKSD